MNKKQLEELHKDFLSEENLRESIEELLEAAPQHLSLAVKFKLMSEGEDIDWRTLLGWYEYKTKLNIAGYRKLSAYVKKALPREK
tara:strand:+ start:1521 stop:1775 length:255 start_codon:yes stop_codon:yes gene_type:complete